jgi:hypothetical protein
VSPIALEVISCWPNEARQMPQIWFRNELEAPRALLFAAGGHVL